MNDPSASRSLATGQDNPALLAAYLLDGRGGADSIAPQDIPVSVPASGTLWLHLDYSEASARQLLSTLEGLPAQVVENLQADDARPRSDPLDGGLLVILRGVNTNPGADPDDMVSIRVWLEPGRIITTRRRRLKSVQDLRDALTDNEGPSDPASFLTQLIDRLGYRAGDVITDLEDAIDELEARLDGDMGKIAALRHDLSDLRRQAAVLRRHLAPQRDALERLTREISPVLPDSTRLKLRDEADMFRRHVEELDLARERAMVAHEQLQSMIAEQQNQRMYLLSIVAAVFLPLSFVTGLLGMNVGGIPGEGKAEAFSILLLVMLGLALGLFWLFRWRRWL
jgi:zinc transporter